MVLEPISRQKGAATGRAGRGSAEIFDSVYNMIICYGLIQNNGDDSV